jgi:hydroxymethylbilane synthase
MLRGNLDTRLRKLDEGQYDAIILAAAGLRRLGWADRIQELIPIEIMCPAVGQGALAIETRNDGLEAQHMVAQLDHTASRLAITAERALLAKLEGGCQVPIGAYATVLGHEVHLRSIVASPDGLRVVRAEATGTDPQRVGEDLGREMLELGAREILKDVYAA